MCQIKCKQKKRIGIQLIAGVSKRYRRMVFGKHLLLQGFLEKNVMGK
jgi:hypothetical protein